MGSHIHTKLAGSWISMTITIQLNEIYMIYVWKYGDVDDNDAIQ